MKKRHSLNIQYPLLTDLGNYPAVSIGIRDLLGTGREHDSVYFALSHNIPLSDRQDKLLKELRVNAGVGTSYMGGPFIGVQARLRSGLRIEAEIYRHRPNVSVGLPLARNLQIKAYSLDGDVYYGIAFSLIR